MICFTFAMGTATGSSTEGIGMAGRLAATALIGADAMAGIRTDSGTCLFFSGLSGSVGTVSGSPATTHRVLSITLSSGFWEPVIFLSQR